MTKIPLISKNYIPYVNQSVNSAKSLETAEINHLTGVLSRYSRAKENNIKKKVSAKKAETEVEEQPKKTRTSKKKEESAE